MTVEKTALFKLVFSQSCYLKVILPMMEPKETSISMYLDVNPSTCGQSGVIHCLHKVANPCHIDKSIS